jgi:hypothetical protein
LRRNRRRRAERLPVASSPPPGWNGSLQEGLCRMEPGRSSNRDPARTDLSPAGLPGPRPRFPSRPATTPLWAPPPCCWPAPQPGRASATALAAIYPNPFNPRTVIAFELAEAGAVELAIYDLAEVSLDAGLRARGAPPDRTQRHEQRRSAVGDDPRRVRGPCRHQHGRRTIVCVASAGPQPASCCAGANVGAGARVGTTATAPPPSCTNP